MSLSRFDRKRTERFAEFIDVAAGPHTHRRTSVDHELTPLTLLTRRLRDLPADGAIADSAPTDDFRSALRSFLVATAERDGVGATAAPATRAASAADTAAWQAIRPSNSALAAKTQVVRQVSGRGPGRARLAILAGVAAGAIVLSGVSAASTGALPGDPLYSVKRSTERAQLALAGSDASRGRLYLEFARGRLAEARQVDPSRLSSVLADMDLQTTKGVALLLAASLSGDDPNALNSVMAFVSQQHDALLQLGDALSPGGGQPLRRSLDVLNSISARVTAIRTAVKKGCPIPSEDWLGPEPSVC